MIRFLLKRLTFMIITLLGVCLLTFFLMSYIPGSTAEMILKYTVTGLEESATQDQLAQISSQYNLNDPLYIQFIHWVGNAVFHGDLGNSFLYHEPVVYLIELHILPTIELAIASICIATIVGIPIGIYAAIRENKVSDTILRISTILGAAMPGFWVGLLLILVFAVTLKLVPVVNTGWTGLILPSIALSLHSMAAIVRVTRTSMLETLGNEYIRFAVAKGLPTSQIITRHALKNALLPVITVLGFQLGHLLGGTMIIENIFTWPGIGNLLVSAIQARDIPLIQGCVLTIVAMFLLVNFSVDLIYTYLDPRIRYG